MKQSIKNFVLTMLVALVSYSASAHDFEVDGMYYNVLSFSDLTCEVTYEGDIYSSAVYTGDVKIPSKVTYSGKTLKVTSIGKSAFDGCSSLTSIEIPNSVTSISGSAFSGCSSLTSVEIPNSVTRIGEYAFCGCKSLTSIEIPNSVTSIGIFAFYGCSSLTSVEIPNSVTSIGDDAFSYCSSLTSVEIPNSVTSIGDDAFSYCSSLTSIEIPNSVTSIGTYAFSNCSSLTSVEIPNSVTSIGEYAFYKCTSLTSLKIPFSVTYIGYCAVVGSGIKEIEIVKGIKSLPYLYKYNNSHYYTLFSYDWKTTCDSLKKIVIADSNESLAVPAYYEGIEFNILPKLEELYIGRNLTTHSETSHKKRYISNEHLKKIEYGDSVTAEETVVGCTGLKEIVYGKGISSIKTNNLSYSEDSLTAIYVKANTPPTVTGTFKNKTYMNLKVYVPTESLDAYKSADVWKDFWNIEGYDFTTGIATPTIDKADKPDAIYDLNGRKLTSPKKGLNIINGKKVVVK